MLAIVVTAAGGIAANVLANWVGLIVVSWMISLMRYPCSITDLMEVGGKLFAAVPLDWCVRLVNILLVVLVFFGLKC